MRTKKAVINSLTAILGEIVTIICGFILPRLILSAFGSEYNGIVSSINQFISCVVLLRAGVGGVTRAALYKPLADYNTEEISAIINATEKFMKKISCLFLIALILFASLYPFLVSDEFDWLFSFTLVLILGISTFAQNYFGITYQMLIQADQRLYVYTILNIVTTILNTIVAAILILGGASIHIVKLGSAAVFALNPIILKLYVKKAYRINKNVPANNNAISQRWDAFAQQVAAFVNNNTDVIILTAFANLKEVSVYTVYCLVGNGLQRLENTLCNGVGAAFGNMLAKNEDSILNENVKVFEFLVFTTSSFLFICGATLIVPFVMVYTKGIIDVNYSRWAFGILLCINQFLFCIRLPYQMVVEAAGHFKQTRNGSVFEAAMNIIVSAVLVSKYGLIGVTIGTFCALSFRTFQYAIYASKNILHRPLTLFYHRLIVSLFQSLLFICVYHVIPKVAINNYSLWCFWAITISIMVGFVILVSILIFDRQVFLIMIRKIRGLVNK